MNDNSNQNNNKSWVEVPSFVNNSNNNKQPKPPTTDRFGDYEDSSSFVEDVSSSLARQVQEDMNRTTPLKQRSQKKKKKKNRAIKITLYTLLTLSVLFSLLCFTKGGQKLILGFVSDYIYGNLDYKNEETNGGTIKEPFKPTDKIVNILLIGVEEIKNAKNTDTMIIATMNTEDHTLKLTSLMRDLYVDIPGHGKNRLNAVYALGKIQLLSETIEQNLGIEINGYAKVNFENFEKIVDIVNGVKITLTDKEANYLNTTNYISQKKYRNVVEGTQTLNGNQALGYCRIRKRPTATESNDFGRTQRHRIVLNAIFDKVKSKNFLDMAFLMDKILNNVDIETNISKSEFKYYLEEAVSLKVKQLDTFRVPTDDNYENIKVTIGKLPNRDVISPKDWDKMRSDLKAFIDGNSTEKQIK